MSIEQSQRFGPLATELVDRFLSVDASRVAQYPSITCVEQLPHALALRRRHFV